MYRVDRDGEVVGMHKGTHHSPLPRGHTYCTSMHYLWVETKDQFKFKYLHSVANDKGNQFSQMQIESSPIKTII